MRMTAVIKVVRSATSHDSKAMVTWCCFLRIRQIKRGMHLQRNQGNRASRVNTITEENQYARLADSVTPYHYRSYERQLQTKSHILGKSLRSAVNIIRNNRPTDQYSPAIQKQQAECDGQMCPFIGVKPAPEIFFYRNKDQMSIGRDVNGVSRTVGLYVGKSSHGKVVCVSPRYLINVKKRHKEIINVYQDFLRLSPRGEFQHMCAGYWSSVVLRSTQQGETMLTVIYRQLLKEVDDHQEVMEELRQYFQTGQGKELDLTSLYLRPSRYIRWHNAKARLILGSPHITETVLGRTFRISPDSFFQTNTPAAEVLYSTIRDYVKLSSARTVVDVCCGTGTIGILMADLVDKVVGVEIVEQAVDDANVNARINGVTNAEFVCGKAHRLLRDVLPKMHLPGDVFAVVNPGRDGVNLKVVNALRACTQIKHIVYVSCKPHGNALINFVDLIVPENERVQGIPFMSVEAVGVDMFPQTSHSELVVLFQR